MQRPIPNSIQHRIRWDWQATASLTALSTSFSRNLFGHMGQKIKKEFTKQDTLRGSITPEREWWDLIYYHLDIVVNPDTKHISGKKNKALTHTRFDFLADLPYKDIVLFPCLVRTVKNATHIKCSCFCFCFIFNTRERESERERVKVERERAREREQKHYIHPRYRAATVVIRRLRHVRLSI